MVESVTISAACRGILYHGSGAVLARLPAPSDSRETDTRKKAEIQTILCDTLYYQ